MAILRYSSFASNANGHGGERRTSQISELINSTGHSIRELEGKRPSCIERYLYSLKFLIQYRSEIQFSKSALGNIGNQYYKNIKALEEWKNEKLVIWESTSDYSLLYAAKKLKFKIIALPHNLESLMPNNRDSITRKSLPSSFINEIKHLSIANTIFCISREEQWLLRNFGLDANYLPYFPTQKSCESFMHIRELRKSTHKADYLILGTAYNPSTKEGILELLSWINELKKNDSFSISIAGYGTELLSKEIDCSKYHLYGSVDDHTLTTLMSSCKAILIHQKVGTGALTRIPEMLIAGIPIIAYSGACRSAFEYKGIHIYECINDLKELLKQELETPPILRRPLIFENRFVKQLKSFLE